MVLCTYIVSTHTLILTLCVVYAHCIPIRTNWPSVHASCGLFYHIWLVFCIFSSYTYSIGPLYTHRIQVCLGGLWSATDHQDRPGTTHLDDPLDEEVTTAKRNRPKLRRPKLNETLHMLMLCNETKPKPDNVVNLSSYHYQTKKQTYFPKALVSFHLTPTQTMSQTQTSQNLLERWGWGISIGMYQQETKIQTDSWPHRLHTFRKPTQQNSIDPFPDQANCRSAEPSRGYNETRPKT